MVAGGYPAIGMALTEVGKYRCHHAGAVGACGCGRYARFCGKSQQPSVASVPRMSSGFAEAAGDISVSGRTSGTKGLH